MGDDVHTSLVIFGASGDLTQRKLIPSLFNLFLKGRLRGPFGIIGHSKTAFTNEQFRTHLGYALRKHATFKYTDDEWQAFVGDVSYHQGGYDVADDFSS